MICFKLSSFLNHLHVCRNLGSQIPLFILNSLSLSLEASLIPRFRDFVSFALPFSNDRQHWFSDASQGQGTSSLPLVREEFDFVPLLWETLTPSCLSGVALPLSLLFLEPEPGRLF